MQQPTGSGHHAQAQSYTVSNFVIIIIIIIII